MVGKVLGAIGCVFGITGISMAGNTMATAHEKTDITPVASQIDQITKEMGEIIGRLDLLDVDTDYTNKDIALIAKELRARLEKLETKKARREKKQKGK